MIEINLLPEELKPSKARVSLEDIDTGYLIYLIPLILGTLVFVHIYFTMANMMQGYQLNKLTDKWNKLEPGRKTLEKFKQEYSVVSEDMKNIEELNKEKIIWSEKLNKLSLNLPTGIWFNEISLIRKDFALKASVVSFKKDEITLINRFLDNLRNDDNFFKDFSRLDLTSLQKRVIGGYDVADFVLLGSLKESK